MRSTFTMESRGAITTWARGLALLAPLYKAHIPTGELDERAIIRMLIADFGVRPLRRNWRTVLAIA